MHLRSNWPLLSFLTNSDQSHIKPEWHEDGRIIHMDYETTERILTRHTQLAQGNHFLAKADISSCFPSIYAHAIDWALRGKATAKRLRNDGSWQALLDARSRNIQDGETKGLMIGPAVSNLLAEIVLQKVDETLLSHGHVFTRYVDDYTAYCLDRSDAERFVVDLHRALGEYRLDINTKKTQIYDLHLGDHEDWISIIYSALPDEPAPAKVSRYLRRCESLAAEFRSKSVLKLAVKLLAGLHEDENAPVSTLEIDELVRLCQYHPHLAPFLARQMGLAMPTLSTDDADRFEQRLTEQLDSAADRDETDVALWLIHIIRSVLVRSISDTTCSKLLSMNDDLVSVALVNYCTEHQPAVVSQVKNWDYVCPSDYERHWLVRYELWRVNLLSDSDISNQEKTWMSILRRRNVYFSKISN